MKNLKIILCFFLMSSSVMAQNQKKIELSQIFAGDTFEPKGSLQTSWWDENTYTYFDVDREARSYAIIKNDIRTNTNEELVHSKYLIPEGEDGPLIPSNYEWSDDQKKLLIFTNTKRVWRANTKGDFYLFDLLSKKLKKIGGGLPESSLMFAKFSPDATKVAYVSGFNLYVEDLKTEEIKQLTFDGSRSIINGTFDWVYEEEFSCRDGFRWSPDGTKIGFWQLDASGIRDYYMINNTDSVYSQIVPVQYPKVGYPNSACRVGVINLESGKRTFFETPGNPRDNYIPRMMWGTESEFVYLQHFNRHQNTLTVLKANAKSAEVKQIYQEIDETWIDAVNDWTWLDGGEYFLWLSEKSGWRQLYKISKDGKKILQITKGNYDVIGLESVNKKTGNFYYIASPDNATERYLYLGNLKKKISKRITPETFKGSNYYNIGPNGIYAFHSFSKTMSPYEKTLINVRKHEVIRTIEDNKELKEKIAHLDLGKTEFFKVKNKDSLELDCWMIKPSNFDPNKKYPVIFYVYGEPFGTTVRNSWMGDRQHWHWYLTQQGYIVMSVENRGTPVPKGREWRKSIYGKIGVVSSEDQAAAAEQISKWDFVDENRIGIWGWSGGGSMTLNMMFRYPEIYKTGVSVAPVTNVLYYDNIYEERYMGLVTEHPERYTQSSPISFAKNLKGNLMLIHGTGDDNVHYQHAEALVNELVKHNLLFSFMAYPNRSHGLWEGKNTKLHVYNTMTNYFLRNLEPGGK